MKPAVAKPADTKRMRGMTPAGYALPKDGAPNSESAACKSTKIIPATLLTSHTPLIHCCCLLLVCKIWHATCVTINLSYICIVVVLAYDRGEHTSLGKTAMNRASAALEAKRGM